MPQPEDSPKEAAKKERYKYSTDQLMNQFKKLESGLGNSKEFNRGWIWNFEWCSEDPKKARPRSVAYVEDLMATGMPFEEAFDHVLEHGSPYDDHGA